MFNIFSIFILAFQNIKKIQREKYTDIVFLSYNAVPWIHVAVALSVEFRMTVDRRVKDTDASTADWLIVLFVHGSLLIIVKA